MLPENFKDWTADEKNGWLRQLLKEDHQVTFTKVDGSVRVMPCTLRTGAMPLKEQTVHHSTRAYNPEVLSVWCLDKSEWRSFKVNNVTDVQSL